MSDLISREEALELFPLILSGELLSIATIREQLRELPTVEAVPLSVIEDIKAEMEEYRNNCKDAMADKTVGAIVYAMMGKQIEIIDRKVKEIEHD